MQYQVVLTIQVLSKDMLIKDIPFAGKVYTWCTLEFSSIPIYAKVTLDIYGHSKDDLHALLTYMYLHGLSEYDLLPTVHS